MVRKQVTFPTCVKRPLMLCLLKMKLLAGICWIAAAWLTEAVSASTHHGGLWAPCPSNTQDCPPKSWAHPDNPHHTSPTPSYKKMHLVYNVLGLKHSRHPTIWCYYSVINWRHLHKAPSCLGLSSSKHTTQETIPFKNLEWWKWMKSSTVVHSCPFLQAAWLCGGYLFFMLFLRRW